MKKPWELDQPWFTITSMLAGILPIAALVVLIEVFT